jgi:GNAT superfamily N-acetyltransferase
MRDGDLVRLSLVADLDVQVVGHFIFSDLRIISKSGSIDALALAPMAVVPKHQRKGIGSELIRTGLELCCQDGHRIVIVLGHRTITFDSDFHQNSLRRFSRSMLFFRCRLLSEPGLVYRIFWKVGCVKKRQRHWAINRIRYQGNLIREICVICDCLVLALAQCNHWEPVASIIACSNSAGLKPRGPRAPLKAILPSMPTR